jgi:hypothetical protein
LGVEPFSIFKKYLFEHHNFFVQPAQRAALAKAFIALRQPRITTQLIEKQINHGLVIELSSQYP